jgi:hypothetical protein
MLQTPKTRLDPRNVCLLGEPASSLKEMNRERMSLPVFVISNFWASTLCWQVTPVCVDAGSESTYKDLKLATFCLHSSLLLRF